ncbi:MAG: sterol desaturase family protein [Acidimicrobiia bacterium]|nr:sterol desaturase family protein [Acidimicrobiia bacterium]
MREGTGFGSGWISGVVSATLGLMGLGAVACLHYPELLTTPNLREVYPLGFIRGLIHFVLITAFAFGVLSLVLRKDKRLGAVGVTAVILASLWGGAGVATPERVLAAEYIGLDFFLLDLFVLALVFVPVERLYPRIREQKIFRRGWRTDLAYFFTSHVLVQALLLVTAAPAAFFFRWAIDSEFQRAVAAQPGWVQFLAMVVAADFAGYWIHRLFHMIPWLWRFHAIHHSSTEMDWLAGSRLHIFDIVVTRAWAFVPLYALGFAPGPLTAYLVFISFHAVFVHANVRFRFGRWKWVLGTPQYHHWHHSAEVQDRNFAIHLPVIDWVFGTLHLPGEEFPGRYGIDGEEVPENFLGQLRYPLGKS